MENFEFLKDKLIRAINESSDKDLIFKLWEMINPDKGNMIAEPQSVYGSEKTMSEQGLQELAPYHLEMIRLAEEDIKHGRIISNEDLKKKDEKWMKW